MAQVVDKPDGRAGRLTYEALRSHDVRSSERLVDLLCLGLMQNATPSEQQLLARTITELEAGDLDSNVRVYLVGLSLMNFAGAGVLEGAVPMLHGGD